MIYPGMSDEERSQLRHAARQDYDPLGFCMKSVHRDRHGKILDPGVWRHNSIVNLGYKSIWDVYFKGTTVPANQLLALVTSFSPAFSLTTVVGEVTFVTGTGYADASLAYADWTNAGNPMVASAASKVFTAGGTWTAAIGAAILTPTRAILIDYDAFAAARTLYNLDTLTVTSTLTREAATE